MQNFQVIIQGSDLEQLRVNLVSAAQAFDQAPLKVHVTTEAPKDKTIRGIVSQSPTAEKAVIAAVTHEEILIPDVTPEIITTSNTDLKSKKGEISLTHVRAQLAELTRNGGSDQVVAALAAIGCRRLTDVAPEQYSNLLASLGLQ